MTPTPSFLETGKVTGLRPPIGLVTELGLEPTFADSSSLLFIPGEKEGPQVADLVPSVGRVE